MATLTINGTEIPVRAPANLETLILQAVQWLESGDFSAARHGDAVTALRWPVETELLTTVEKDALEAVLLTPGTVTVASDIAGSGIECVAVPKGLQAGPLDDQWRASFELIGVGT